MEKPADTQYPIHELLRRRWSPRAFLDKPVSQDHLCSLLEAARWAPSSNNEQPWHFLVATKQDQADYDRLLSCLKNTNQLWARLAPVLMMSVATLAFMDDGAPNRHAFHDVGLAVENLVVQATALGLMAHQMAGIFPDMVRELYGLPAEYEAVAAIAIGYPGSGDVARALSPARGGQPIAQADRRLRLFRTLGKSVTDCDGIVRQFRILVPMRRSINAGGIIERRDSFSILVLLSLSGRPMY